MDQIRLNTTSLPNFFQIVIFLIIQERKETLKKTFIKQYIPPESSMGFPLCWVKAVDFWTQADNTMALFSILIPTKMMVKTHYIDFIIY